MTAVLSLMLGGIAGALAFWIGLPLPWMLGPMIGATLASSLGMRVFVLPLLPTVALPVVGVMLGSRITAELIDQAGQFAFTLALLFPVVAVTGAVSFLFYRKVAGFDGVTAYYAAMPGGLNDMMILGEAAGGDGRRIALAHAARVLCVIAFVAVFFGIVLGVRSGSGPQQWVGLGDIGPMAAVWLILAALVGMPFGKVLRMPAPFMLGPMLVSGVVHVAGFVDVPPPNLMVIAAQIVLGLRIGSRFSGVPMRAILSDLGLGAISSLLMILVAVLFAWLVAAVTGVALSQAFLAFSPGGFIEMSLLALALGQEVAYVSFAHIVRIVIVIFGAPVAFRLLGVRPWG